jgi:hypothetical protein
MKKSALLKIGLLMCATSFFASGCIVTPEAGVEVESDPPAPLIETIPPDPGGGVVWVGGEWAWHDHWVWEKGHYDHPPHAGAVWVPHQYVNHGGRHTYVHGRWK